MRQGQGQEGGAHINYTHSSPTSPPWPPHSSKQTKHTDSQPTATNTRPLHPTETPPHTPNPPTHLRVDDRAAADVGARLLRLVGDGHGVAQQHDAREAALRHLGGGEQDARVGRLSFVFGCSVWCFVGFMKGFQAGEGFSLGAARACTAHRPRRSMPLPT